MTTSGKRRTSACGLWCVGAFSLALSACSAAPDLTDLEISRQKADPRAAASLETKVRQVVSPCAPALDCWQNLSDSPMPVVHGNMLSNGRVLLFAGAAEQGLPFTDNAVLWNPATFGTSQIDIPDDFFCTHQSFLPDGRLLLVGGDGNGLGHINNHSYIFTPNPTNPATGTFAFSGDMAFARWYPTSVRLGDGRVLAVSGDSSFVGSVPEVEVFDGVGSWNVVAGATRYFDGLYPGLHLLPSGEIFYTRTSWNPESGTQTAYLTMTGPTSGFWTDYGQQEFWDRQEGMSLVTIDTTVNPTRTRIYVFGGGQFPGGPGNNNQTAEFIEFTTGIAGSSWQRTADMNFGRSNVNAVALPTGKILIVGGEEEGRFSPANPIEPVETYDPASDSWTVGAELNRHRGYHTSIILLPDGRVVGAGGADVVEPSMEIYYPDYLSQGSRPTISNAPATVAYGAAFTIDTPEGNSIASVSLVSPIAVTHQTDPQQRYIKLPIEHQTATNVGTRAPAHGNIAPPGDYMLFVVNQQGVPSEGRFIRIGAQPPQNVVLEAHFATGTDGFSYSDDGFRGTNQPNYASGTRLATGGFTDGGLRVRLGNVNSTDILGMSGGWARSFSLAAPTHLKVSFRYRLDQAAPYEADEISQVLASFDGQLLEVGGQDYVAQLAGGSPSTTGWQLIEINLGAVSAGNHTLRIGGYNNKKTDTDEVSDILIDDVLVQSFEVQQVTLLTANFNAGTDAFVNADDLFRGTSQPAYASGNHLPTGGFQGGGLGVNLGNVNNTTIVGMSNGWSRLFAVAVASNVKVSFRYNLTQSPHYEGDEFSQALLSVDGLLFGQPGTDFVAQIVGNGENGPNITTGWQFVTIDVGVLQPGWHQLSIGAFNNKKTATQESTTMAIDDIAVTAQ